MIAHIGKQLKEFKGEEEFYYKTKKGGCCQHDFCNKNLNQNAKKNGVKGKRALKDKGCS